MLLLAVQAAICFVALHAGPAEHFATFAKNLSNDGVTVEVFASGPALKKFQDHGFETVTSFSLDHLSLEEEDALAEQLAKVSSKCTVIMTDVGHPFDIKLQKAVARQSKTVHRLAYYDNSEPYVPGGYSETASQVMLAADEVLFANSHLANAPLFQEPGKEILFGTVKKIGIGYYPTPQADEIAKRRISQPPSIRRQLFLKNNLEDKGQKVLVYFGGNNNEYFTKAFPAFLSFLTEGIQSFDFSHLIFVLQQHPGAKKINLDVNMLTEWASRYGNEAYAPKIVISDLTSEDAQVVADEAFYYQTSMAPQFILAGIPTVQIGHETFPDILVRNRLIPTVTNTCQFIEVIENLACPQYEIPRNVVLEQLGIKKDWFETLKKHLELEGNISK
jgi:hypothetical protein